MDTTIVPDEADFAVRVNGDSMTPVLADGQIIYIHKQDTLESGEIGIFSLNGNAYVKNLFSNKRGISLVSLNKAYAPIPIAEYSNLRIFGKAVM